jgi:hypothetical protein
VRCCISHAIFRNIASIVGMALGFWRKCLVERRLSNPVPRQAGDDSRERVLVRDTRNFYHRQAGSGMRGHMGVRDSRFPGRGCPDGESAYNPHFIYGWTRRSDGLFKRFDIVQERMGVFEVAALGNMRRRILKRGI